MHAKTKGSFTMKIQSEQKLLLHFTNNYKDMASNNGCLIYATEQKYKKKMYCDFLIFFIRNSEERKKESDMT